jgi:hypothetical protein
MPENPTKDPTMDPKAWQRNKTTAWLEFVDRLSSWIWQDNEGAATRTLVLDDDYRRRFSSFLTSVKPPAVCHSPKIGAIKLLVVQTVRRMHTDWCVLSMCWLSPLVRIIFEKITTRTEWRK